MLMFQSLNGWGTRYLCAYIFTASPAESASRAVRGRGFLGLEGSWWTHWAEEGSSPRQMQGEPGTRQSMSVSVIAKRLSKRHSNAVPLPECVCVCVYQPGAGQTAWRGCGGRWGSQGRQRERSLALQERKASRGTHHFLEAGVRCSTWNIQHKGLSD